MVRVDDAVGNLTFEPVFDMRTSGLQSRNPVNDVDGEVEAVHLIAYHELQRRVDIAFFLISADVYVGVVCPPVCELMNHPGIAMKVEYDRLVFGKQGIEVAVR